MKTLRKLELLILVLIKTTPQIIKTYKLIYKNLILQEEKIIEQSKRMLDADIKIKTKYVDEPKEYNEKVKQIFKRQKAEIARIENYKKGVKENELEHRNVL